MPDKEVMTREDVAEKLGVCAETVSHWVAKKGLPVRKLSKNMWRFIWSEVLEWLKTQPGGANNGRSAA